MGVGFANGGLPQTPAPTPVTPTAPAPVAPSPIAPVSPAPMMTTSSNLYPAGVTPDALAHTASVIANAKLQPKNTSTFDVDKYFQNVDTMNPGITDLYATRNAINNRRNDIATGKVDPYDLAKKYGVVFSPGDQSSVNKAISQIYDPMLEDVNARIQHQQDLEKTTAAGKTWGDGAFASVPNQYRDEINALGSKYMDNPLVKAYQLTSPAYTFISGLDPSKASNSEIQTALTQFTKNLDPGTAAREGEVALTTAYASNPTLLNQLKIGWNKYVTTGAVLPESAIRQIASAFKGSYDAQKKNVDNYRKTQIERTKEYYGSALSPHQLDLLFPDLTASGYGSSLGVDPQTQQALDQALQNGSISQEEYDYVTGGGGQSFNQVGGGTNQASNRPQANNNPLNIKASTFTKSFPGVIGLDGKPASDGGQFLVFNSPQAGFEAAAKLLGSGVYKNLTVDQALRKWSNNGYGGEIVPHYAGATIAQLSPAQIQAIIKTMAQREGFYA